MRYHKILPLLVILIFAGCGKTANEAGDSEIPCSSEPEMITYDYDIPRSSEYETITYDSLNLDITSEDGKTVYVSATYMEPTIHLEDETAAQKIQSEFDALRSSYDADLASIYEDAKAMANEPYFVSFGLDQHFTTIRDDARILSMESLYCDFRMGPHSSDIYNGLNFDLITGEKLTLDSISTDKAALLSSAHDYIESLLQLPSYAERLYKDVTLEETMNTIDNSILTDGRWYFTNMGITFIANYYEIGSYVSNAFFFLIPFEKLEGLKPDYTYSGAYVLPIPISMSETKDLNGDGMEDTIRYDITDADYPAGTPSLYINDTDFTFFIPKNKSRLSPLSDNYYLIDLDASDPFIEIALISYDNNEHTITAFFRYDGKDVSYMGYIRDFPEKSTCKLYGDGTLTARIPLNPFKSYDMYISAQYRISDAGALELIPQK